MTDIVPVPPDPSKGSLVPLDKLGDVIKFAEEIGKSAIVPGAFRGQTGSIAIAIVWGAEVGLGPMASLQSIDVIDGRANMKAELKLALIRKAGHHVAAGTRPECAVCMHDDSLPTVEGVVNGVATIHSQRRDGSRALFTYTIAEAKQAKLTEKKNWVNHSSDMLWARVVTRCGRREFSDVLMGLAGDEYEAEEIAAAEAPPSEQVTHRPPPVTAKPPAEVEEDIEDAEEVPDESVPPAAPEMDPIDEPEPVLTSPITNDEIRHMNAAFGDLGIRQREEKHKYIREVVGHDFASSKDLTTAEAQKVIEKLEAEKAMDAELGITIDPPDAAPAGAVLVQDEPQQQLINPFEKE